MKTIYFFIVIGSILLISINGHAQLPGENSAIKIKQPLLAGYSAKRLSKKLTKDCQSDTQKVWVISNWIAREIKYDVKAYLKLSNKQYGANKILRRRKALCSGYSTLFVGMCNYAGIKAFAVQGYDKGIEYRQGDKFFFDLHEWNAVEIDSNYYLLDLTWASGGIVKKKQLFRKFLYETFQIPYMAGKIKFQRQYNPLYLTASPEKFSEDHLPDHPMWQLKRQVTSIQEFEKPGSSKAKSDSIDFRYYIAQYKSMTSQEKTLHVGDVSKKFNKANNKNKAFAYGGVGCAIKKTADYSYKRNPISIRNYSYLQGYYDTTIASLKRYHSDNATVNKINLDSTEKRHITVNNFSRRELKANTTKYLDNKRSGKMLLMKNLTLERESEMAQMSNERMTNVSIEYEKRPEKESVKSVQKKQQNQKNIARNNKKIDSLMALMPAINQNIDKTIDSTNMIFLEITNLYGMRKTSIELEMDMVVRYEKLQIIKTTQQVMDSMRARILSLYKKNALVEKRSLTRYTYQRDSVNRAIVKLISANRAMIRAIKKSTTKENGEDYYFFKENLRLANILETSLEKLQTKSYVNSLKFDRLKIENRYFKRENKSLKKLIKIEERWRQYMIKKENYRFRVFKSRGIALEKQCRIASADLAFKLAGLNKK